MADSWLVMGLVVSLAACGQPVDREVSAGEDVAARANVGELVRETNGVTGEGRFGLGVPAAAELIAAWDIDVSPNGAGLPPGTGSVEQGLEVWDARCLACHGPTGTEGPFDLITGRLPDDDFPFGDDPSVRSTVGNYWPYATTLFDYTRRAMPFDFPGTLTDEEVYSVVGAMLYFNELLPRDASVDSTTIVDTHMPARDRFVPDNRTGGTVIR